MKARPTLCFAFLCLISGIILPFCGYAQNFTAGNLVIYRVGDGVANLSANGSRVYLDEYTPTGTFVRSVVIPYDAITTVSPNFPLIASGIDAAEGMLVLSSNKQYLTLTGYGRNMGGPGSLPGTNASSVNRVIGRVDYTTTINTTTALTDFASGNNPTSAVTENGTNFWMTGQSGGVRYATLGNTTSTQLNSSVTSNEQVNIFGSQLYLTTTSTSLTLASVGAGTPITTGQTVTNLPGMPTTTSVFYQFTMFDMSVGMPGLDVLYIADEASGIRKYSLVAGSWVLNGTVGVGSDKYRGLTASASGNTVNIYAIRKGGTSSSGGGEFVSLVDNTGYNGAFSGTPTLLVTAANRIAFRGIAFAPEPFIVVPIKFESVFAKPFTDYVDVLWAVSEEENVDYYSVQRSTDGINFSEVGRAISIRSGYRSEYRFRDSGVEKGSNYFYKIVAVLFDRNMIHSRIVTADITDITGGVLIYPNPIMGSNFTLRLKNPENGFHTLKIYNPLGQQVVVQKILFEGLPSEEKLISFELLPPGIYSIRLTGPDKSYRYSLIVKN